jgi:hypothetical protein
MDKENDDRRRQRITAEVKHGATWFAAGFGIGVLGVSLIVVGVWTAVYAALEIFGRSLHF